MRAYMFTCTCFIAAGFLGKPAAAVAQNQSESVQTVQQEIQQLKQDLDALKEQYGNRLAALERKLAVIQANGPATVQPAVLTTLVTPPEQQQPQEQQPAPQQQPPQDQQS